MLSDGIPPGFRGGVLCVCMVITYSKSKDQPGKVASPARGQLNREVYRMLLSTVNDIC